MKKNVVNAGTINKKPDITEVSINFVAVGWVENDGITDCVNVVTFDKATISYSLGRTVCIQASLQLAHTSIVGDTSSSTIYVVAASTAAYFLKLDSSLTLVYARVLRVGIH